MDGRLKFTHQLLLNAYQGRSECLHGGNGRLCIIALRLKHMLIGEFRLPLPKAEVLHP